MENISNIQLNKLPEFKNFAAFDEFHKDCHEIIEESKLRKLNQSMVRKKSLISGRFQCRRDTNNFDELCKIIINLSMISFIKNYNACCKHILKNMGPKRIWSYEIENESKKTVVYLTNQNDKTACLEFQFDPRITTNKIVNSIGFLSLYMLFPLAIDVILSLELLLPKKKPTFTMNEENEANSCHHIKKVLRINDPNLTRIFGRGSDNLTIAQMIHKEYFTYKLIFKANEYKKSIYRVYVECECLGELFYYDTHANGVRRAKEKAADEYLSMVAPNFLRDLRNDVNGRRKKKNTNLQNENDCKILLDIKDRERKESKTKIKEMNNINSAEYKKLSVIDIPPYVKESKNSKEKKVEDVSKQEIYLISIFFQYISRIHKITHRQT